MNLYYQSLIEQIQKWIENGNGEQARLALQQELAMPYIPEVVQIQLEQLASQLKAMEPAQSADLSIPRLEAFMEGNPMQQEAAASRIGQLNLRMHKELMQKFLNNASDPLLRGRLIEALMEQKLDDAFTVDQQGLEIEFIPSLLTPAQEDEGMKRIIEHLSSWLEGENPAFYAFGLSLLEQERLALRPFDFSELPDWQVAKALARIVYEAMGMQEEWEAFTEKNRIQNVPDCTLMIEK